MKNTCSVMVVGALLIGSGMAGVAHAEDIRIGAINFIRILDQAPQAEAVRAQIEKEFAPRDRELVAAQKKLKDMEDRLAKDAAIMSESERSNLERDIINARRDLKRGQDEFRDDLTFRRNEEIKKIQEEVLNAIQLVAKQNNYDVVLSDGVLYATPKVDMTQLVIDFLKKKAPAAAGAPAAAAQPAPASTPAAAQPAPAKTAPPQ